MRGDAATQATMLTAATPDALVPQGHPTRRIKPMVDIALAGPSPNVQSDVHLNRATLDTTGASSEGLSANGIVLGAQLRGRSASGLGTTCSSSGSWT